MPLGEALVFCWRLISLGLGIILLAVLEVGTRLLVLSTVCI